MYSAGGLSVGAGGVVSAVAAAVPAGTPNPDEVAVGAAPLTAAVVAPELVEVPNDPNDEVEAAGVLDSDLLSPPAAGALAPKENPPVEAAGAADVGAALAPAADGAAPPKANPVEGLSAASPEALASAGAVAAAAGAPPKLKPEVDVVEVALASPDPLLPPNENDEPLALGDASLSALAPNENPPVGAVELLVLASAVAGAPKENPEAGAALVSLAPLGFAVPNPNPEVGTALVSLGPLGFAAPNPNPLAPELVGLASAAGAPNEKPEDLASPPPAAAGAPNEKPPPLGLASAAGAEELAPAAPKLKPDEVLLDDVDPAAGPPNEKPPPPPLEPPAAGAGEGADPPKVKEDAGAAPPLELPPKLNAMASPSRPLCRLWLLLQIAHDHFTGPFCKLYLQGNIGTCGTFVPNTILQETGLSLEYTGFSTEPPGSATAEEKTKPRTSDR